MFDHYLHIVLPSTYLLATSYAASFSISYCPLQVSPECGNTPGREWEKVGTTSTYAKEVKTDTGQTAQNGGCIGVGRELRGQALVGKIVDVDL